MRKGLLLIAIVWTSYAFAQTNYEKAWKALNQNNWTEAGKWLQEARKDPASARDAFMSNLYLEAYKGKESEIKDFASAIYAGTDNSYPYIYALWFNDAVAGPYGKKESGHHLDLLNKLINDAKAPGTLSAAANYQLGMHYLYSNDFNKINKYYLAVGNIRNWQYVGPFENLSQSGHYKEYGPLQHPEPDAVFKSVTNADIKWFVPADEIKDGWTPVSYQINKYTAVSYAQNFVNAPEDMEVICCVGASGSVKVWINDELVIAESQERVTELDTYNVKCKLKKGSNRVLVQLGYTENSYANFCVRFTDENLRPVPGITGSSVYAPYPKVTGSSAAKKPELNPHFAEAYFTEAIKTSPKNLVNYLLLADVYLRNKKVIEARNIVSEAIEQAPDNCLFRMKLAEVLIKEENRTLLLEELEKIKRLDPESLLVLELNIKEHLDGQKYEDAALEIEKRIQLYGEDESTAEYKLLLLVQEKKYEELIKEVERLYKIYPGNTKVLDMMYAVKKEVYKDKKGAMKLYENYLKNNYNYNAITQYAALLSEQGDNDKALDLKRKLASNFPYSPSEFYNLSKYYYGIKQYDKAEDFIRKSLALSPYNETWWEQLGDIKNEKKNTSEALEAYNQSLKYDPNQYTIINKIRKMDGKPEIHKLFPEIDIEGLVKKDKAADAKNVDYGFYFILDQKDVVLYPGGATEQYCTNVVRITNEKGVDRYKESSIGYGNSQSLLIEKAEIIKKSQAKIQGEINGNEIVFTNLEPGDVVVFKYRLRSYVYGRLAKEFWDKYYFNGQIYTVTTRYNLLADAGQKIYHKVNNPGPYRLEPATRDIENFKLYSWELSNAEPDKDEPLMPILSDVSVVLHLSTIPNWKVIADWYSDISTTKAEEDFEIIALHKKLFPEGQKPMTQFQKAKIIYDYIEANIRYSSVSFRQSAFVPQRPSKTLTTRLGDCKDLSSLFVTLARMSGINAQMVLVETRDNGQQSVILPSVEFNHCIVKAELDKKPYYIELTDNYLPFVSLPNNLNGAVVLEIPYGAHQSVEKSELKFLEPATRTRDMIRRVIDIKPTDSDLEISVRTVKYGHPSSSTRYTYVNLDKEKQLKEMEETVAGGYKNNVKVNNVAFKALDQLNDSVEYVYDFNVKNEVSEIGSMKTFRMVYPDVVASLNNFSADTRVHPVQYWSYEDIDSYETVVNITVPGASKFVELPASESYTFKDMKYSLTYTLRAPNKLTITRKFTNNRQNIPAADYAAFKAFFEKIVKAEQKFIAYK